MPDALDTLQSLTSLTVTNATVALEQGLEAIRAGQTVFDLGHVTAIDSGAVSVMLAWQRAARAAGVRLELKNLPPKLKSLTRLYGVCELLTGVPDAGSGPGAAGLQPQGLQPQGLQPQGLQSHSG